MNKKIVAIFFAVLAAALYAVNIPFSKLLLQHIGPTMLASYLYLGAGIGIGAVFLITKKRSSHTSERITKKDLPYVLGMIVLDMIAPILLITVTHTHDGSTHTHTVEHEHEHEHILLGKHHHHRHSSDKINGHV